MKIKLYYIFSILVLFISNTYAQQPDNDIPFNQQLPNKIERRYGNDLIKDKKMATDYALLIFKSVYKNVDFDNLESIEIREIAENKVWDIKAVRLALPNSNKYFYYNIRINKNTGEVLNIWKDV